MRKTKLAEKSSYKRRVRQTKAPHYRQMRRRRGALFYASISIVSPDLNSTVKWSGRILFVNAKHEVIKRNAQSYLSADNIDRIVKTYREFKEEEGFSAVATIKEIEANDYSLGIPLYVSGIAAEKVSESDLEESITEWFLSSAEVNEAYNNLINKLEVGGEINE